jgi:hypothetical protein
MIDHWTSYVEAVQKATAEAITEGRPWSEIVAEMSRRFPDEFPQSLDRVPTRMLRSRETREGLREYLEWLAQNARLFLNTKLIYAPQDRKTGMRPSAFAANVRAKRAELLVQADTISIAVSVSGRPSARKLCSTDSIPAKLRSFEKLPGHCARSTRFARRSVTGLTLMSKSSFPSTTRRTSRSTASASGHLFCTHRPTESG